MNTNNIKLYSPLRLIAATLVGTTGASLAHEGHGTEGSHWHATDFWGFVLVMAVIGLSLWSRRK